MVWWVLQRSLHQIELRSAWNPSPLVEVDINATRNIGDLPAGSFTTDLAGTRVRLDLSSDLSLSSFVQYDTGSETIGTNTRLRWTFHPLGDVFIVYNHNLEDRFDRWAFDSNQLLVKLQYTMRY